MKEITYTSQVAKYGFYKKDSVDPTEYEKVAEAYIDAKFDKKQAAFKDGNAFEIAKIQFDEATQKLSSLSK